MAIRKPDHFAGISTRIKGRCGTSHRSHNKIRVNCHAVVIRVELREAIVRFDFFGCHSPLANSQRACPSRSRMGETLKRAASS